MNVAQAILNEVSSYHGRVILKPTGELRVTAPTPLPAQLLVRLRQNKQAILSEIKPPLHWWRCPASCEVRFDEIAGHLEYGEGLKRADAEIRAREVLQLEIADWQAWEAQNVA